MYRLKSLVFSVAAFAVACASTGAVIADDAAVVSGAAQPAAEVVQPAAKSPFGGPVLDAGSLDGQRGTADLLLNKMDLDSRVHDNSMENVVLGDGRNSISNGAYSNFNGIALGVQNTGSQTSIQNAVSVIIQLK